MNSDLDLDLEFMMEEGGEPELELELELESESELDLDLGEELDEVELLELEEATEQEEEEDLERVQQLMEKFGKARSLAEENRGEELRNVLQMYRNESVNGFQFKAIENIKAAIRKKFVEPTDNWEKDTLSRAPSAILDTFKPYLGGVYSSICNGLQDNKPVEQIKQEAWAETTRLLRSFNQKMPTPAHRIKETTQVTGYLRNYVVEAIAHLQEYSAKETLIQRDIDEMLREYAYPMLETQERFMELGQMIRSPGLEEQLAFVESVQLSDTFRLQCDFCGEMTEVENLAYVYSYAQTTEKHINVFKPLYRCKHCGRFLLFTRQEFNAIHKGVEKYISDLEPHSSAPGTRFLSVYKPAPEVYRDLLPHLTRQVEQVTEEELGADEFEELREFLAPHIEQWRKRVDSHKSLRVSKVAVLPREQGSLGEYRKSKAFDINVRNLSKYLSVIYGGDYAELKEFAISTLLENFSKDPLLIGLPRFVDDVLSEQFRQAQALAGEYAEERKEQYAWAYRRIAEVTALPFDQVVSMDGIEDKERFDALVRQLKETPVRSYDFVKDLGEMAPYFAFKSIELTPLNKFKWKGVTQSEEMQKFLDEASDLMILSHYAVEFFNDYDRKAIYLGDSLVKGNNQSNNLGSIVLTKDKEARRKKISKIFQNVRKAAEGAVTADGCRWREALLTTEREALAEVFLYCFDFSDALLYFKDFLVALQMGDSALILKLGKMCNYLLNRKNYGVLEALGVVGLQGSFLEGFKRTLAGFTPEEPMEHGELVQWFYLNYFGTMYEEEDILDELPQDIQYVNLEKLRGLQCTEYGGFADTLRKVVEKDPSTAPKEDKLCRLYLYVYGFLAQYQDFIVMDANRSYRSLMADLMRVFLGYGDMMFDLLDIDRNVFSAIVSQIDDFEMDGLQDSPVEQLQYLLGNSISTNALTQELISRALVAGVSADAVVLGEYRSIGVEDMNELQQCLDEFLYPERVAGLMESIWKEIREEG